MHTPSKNSENTFLDKSFTLAVQSSPHLKQTADMGMKLAKEFQISCQSPSKIKTFHEFEADF